MTADDTEEVVEDTDMPLQIHISKAPPQQGQKHINLLFV